MDRTECVVVGAGVVGLAVARALARAGREVVVLEREGLIGSHTSSRNSEVIHAGIYYPKGSAKARLCVAGKAMLYAYAAAHGVPHRRLGKIIVATERGAGGRARGHRPRPPAATASTTSSPSTPPGSRRARAGAARGGRAPLALDRDRRQPRADAELPGRGGGPRRDGRLPYPLRGRRGGARGLRRRGGGRAGAGRGPAPDRGADARQRRRALRRAGGGGDPRARGPAPARDLLLQGQLLRRRRPGAVPPPDLPGARARRPRRAPDPRHGRAGALRPGHRMGRGDRLPPRRPPRRRLLRRDPALLAGDPRRRARARPMPASGRSSFPRAAPPPTSRSRGRRCTACRGSSTSSASRARG